MDWVGWVWVGLVGRRRLDALGICFLGYSCLVFMLNFVFSSPSPSPQWLCLHLPFSFYLVFPYSAFSCSHFTRNTCFLCSLKKPKSQSITCTRLVCSVQNQARPPDSERTEPSRPKTRDSAPRSHICHHALLKFGDLRGFIYLIGRCVGNVRAGLLALAKGEHGSMTYLP